MRHFRGGGVDRTMDDLPQGITGNVCCTGGDNGNTSSVFNPILLTSGDHGGGDLGDYRTEIILLGLCMLGASGRLASHQPVV